MVPPLRRPGRRLLLLLALVLGAAGPLQAAPMLRYQVERRGDLVLIGNTVGFDCRGGIPRPLLGTVDLGSCGGGVSDSEIDVLWRSDDPAPGQASASVAVTPAQARTSAVLALPAGARVAYARLYWAAAQAAGAPPGPTVLLERPGAFMQLVTADASASVDGTSSYYQSGADVTELVQDLGPGVFRVGGIPAASPVGQDSRLSFVAWSLVVLYDRAADPPRNLTLFDGLDRVDDTRPATARLTRFLLPLPGQPAQGAIEGRLGILAYEGDSDTAGDRIRVNGQDLTDALNPADNFFNGTRDHLGQAITVAGDLPQLSGQPGSMNGVDLDVVDLSARLQGGATSLEIAAASSEDVYFLGALVGSVATFKPVLETELTYVNLSRPGAAGALVRPGDLLELTLSVRNVGTDAATDTRAAWTAPPGLTYEPGSLRLRQAGEKDVPRTDAAGDDPGDFDGPSRTLSVRLGQGADAQRGGRLGAGEPAVQARFRARVGADQNGMTVRTGASASAAGEAAAEKGVPPMSWSSGDGRLPNRPVRLSVRECQQAGDCPPATPRCDVAAARCGNGCQEDRDCQAAATGRRCVTPGLHCGCQEDRDCPGGRCEVASGLCRIPQADLSIDVRLQPEPPSRQLPVTEIITVTNKGPDAAPGVVVTVGLPPGARVRDGGLPPPGQGGWDCALVEEGVRCSRGEPLPPGAAPEIRVVFDPPGGATSVDLTSHVATPFAQDPDPTDNGAVRSVDLSDDLWQIAGGGVGCVLAGQGGEGRARDLSLLAFLLCCLLNHRWRRRRR